MLWISSQPATLYYVWQVDVYLNNFKQMGVDLNKVYVVFVYENFNNIPKEMYKLCEQYEEVHFYLCQDTREHTHYIPSIYFNGVKQLFNEFKELENQTVMFHDSDTILTKPVEFMELLEGDTWYFSDTNSYINSDYVLSKGEETYKGMCSIVGIDESIPKKYNNHSGGAQHLIKNSTYEFWDKVEKDSHQLYTYFNLIEPHYKKKFEGDYPIQKWTAGMWSLLWNSWYFGKDVKVTDKLSFCWADNPISQLEGRQFMHNAGILDGNRRMFFKGDYINKIPYGLDLDIDENRCSKIYWDWLKDAEKKSTITN